MYSILWCINQPPSVETLFFLGLAEGFFIYFFMHFSKEKINDTLSLALSYYKHSARSFPWRGTDNPYHVLVSEYMLQQTQVGRVEEKFPSFIKKFPDIKSLADAERKDVLLLWSGLGYNRRAVALHESAKILRDVYNACVPNNRECLLALPGVGDYTSGAVLAFAYNEPVVIVETNIRTVVFHHCLRDESDVEDSVILLFVEKILSRSLDLGVLSSVLYSALMDYGSHLKLSGVQVNSASRHYTKQKKFEGSVRQARGALLRVFIDSNKGVSQGQLDHLTINRVQDGLAGLVADGFVEKRGKYYYLV